MSELQELVDTIMRMNAPAISAFGYGLPGMAGGSAAEQGSMTPAADVIRELKREVAKLNGSIKNPGTGDSIKKTASKIEGNLMNLQVLSVLNEKETDNLINKLHRIIE